jgi:argininosuccinate lyase
VRKGIPFRQAHDVVGKVLREAEKRNMVWTALPLEVLKNISPAFDDDLAARLTVDAALDSKNVSGGTAPESVRRAITTLEENLKTLEKKHDR